jgi:hypothetical protein
MNLDFLLERGSSGAFVNVAACAAGVMLWRMVRTVLLICWDFERMSESYLHARIALQQCPSAKPPVSTANFLAEYQAMALSSIMHEIIDAK